MTQAHSKRINSLLLFAWGPTDAMVYIANSHDLPRESVSIKQIEDNQTQYRIDFSKEILDHLEYDAFLTGFLRKRAPVILDLLRVEPKLRVELSAQIIIDKELGVFQLKLPKLPAAINECENFDFDYWVWHPLQSANERI